MRSARRKSRSCNDFIARFSAGTRSAQVMSRKKEVERLQTTDLARSNIARPFIRFEMKRPSGRHPLEIKGVAKSYDGVKVMAELHGQRSRGEKIALMGRNGAGKTTLLRSLMRNRAGLSLTIPTANFAIDGGQVSGGTKWPWDISRRITRESIRHGMNAIDWLHQFESAGHRRKNCAACWGRCCSAARRRLKPTAALSGGEAARLIFCRLMLQKPNVLVLDEPTNHLDLESINALNIALQKYEGTVLLVTHDHDLIEEVATRIWHFEAGSDRRLQGPLQRIRRRRPRKSLVIPF